MHCKLRFPLLQHIISIRYMPYVPCPADFDPFPVVDFWPCPSPPRPAPPCEKIASPSIPGIWQIILDTILHNWKDIWWLPDKDIWIHAHPFLLPDTKSELSNDKTDEGTNTCWFRFCGFVVLKNWKELTFNTCHCCCPHVQTLTSCWEIIEITCFWPMWNDLAWRVMEITWIWRKHLRESDKLRRHDLWPGRDPYLMFGRLIQMWRRARSHTFRFALPIALGDKCALNETYRSNFSFAYSMSKCECFKEIGDLENVPDSGANFCMWRWVPMQFGTISDSDGAQQNIDHSGRVVRECTC